ncbi:MAG: GNAT family N-acetyltransferase [Hyphomonadaceae bacterium]|nr:GNAT family N-acetyltransferase [Hyphomonadaceae bacterium]
MRRTIRTERLLLRPLELADARRVAQLTSDPDVARMVGMIPTPHPHICAEGFILILRARASLERDFVYAIDRPGEGVIGCAGIHLRGPKGIGAELGYWIGRPHWGAGYATEAARAVAVEASASFGEITASYFLDNPASRRVLEKVGFRDAGVQEMRFSLARRGKTPAKIMRLAALPRAASA